jgi:hypothetical protein
MAGVLGLQERIAARMSGGASLDEVEEGLIDPARLRQDQKSALWLYAWSMTDRRMQLEQANKYVLQVAEVGAD